MRTLILVLVCLSLFFTFQMCNTDNGDLTSLSNNKVQVSKDDPKPCCNAGKPASCNPPGIMGLYTTAGEIDVACECCQDIYDYYGNPPNLYEIEIPPQIVNICTNRP